MRVFLGWPILDIHKRVMFSRSRKERRLLLHIAQEVVVHRLLGLIQKWAQKLVSREKTWLDISSSPLMCRMVWQQHWWWREASLHPLHNPKIFVVKCSSKIHVSFYSWRFYVDLMRFARYPWPWETSFFSFTKLKRGKSFSKKKEQHQGFLKLAILERLVTVLSCACCCDCKLLKTWSRHVNTVEYPFFASDLTRFSVDFCAWLHIWNCRSFPPFFIRYRTHILCKIHSWNLHKNGIKTFSAILSSMYCM